MLTIFRIFIAVFFISNALISTAIGGDNLNSVSWLLGEWISTGKTQRTIEVWQKISEKSFEGYGQVQSVAGDSIFSYESLRLLEMSGGIYFLAKVSHNDYPVAFALTSHSDTSAVFENPTHDFPKKISYQLKAAGMLIVTVGDSSEYFKIQFTKNSNSKIK